MAVKKLPFDIVDRSDIWWGPISVDFALGDQDR